MICAFFGHSDCHGLNSNVLRSVVENLIIHGVDTFYVGHQGNFDNMVLSCLSGLKADYPEISYWVVLAYLPIANRKDDIYNNCSMYPEGLETVHPKYAVERRNIWMIDQADYCICYVNHTWGGAYKFAHQAKRKGLNIINLGSTEL